MRYGELLWGFFFLFSAIFIFSIGLWKLWVYLQYSEILLFKIWEYIFFFVFGIIVVLVSIASMIRSFIYSKADFTDTRTVKYYVKVIVLIGLIYYIYNIFLIIDMLVRW